MVAHDVEILANSFELLNKSCFEEGGIAQMDIRATCKGHSEVVFLWEAEEDIQDCAASSFVCLEEHDICGRWTGCDILVKNRPLPASI